MPGPGKKPIALKQVSGTVQPSRVEIPLVEYEAIDYVPDPPDWLPNAHAVKEWNRLAPFLNRYKLLNEGALSSLGMLCSLHGKLVQLFSAGESPNASMIGSYRNLINDFGLTPVAQGKVKPMTNEDKGNKFASNGKRAA
jgi:phage terminase small subunit